MPVVIDDPACGRGPVDRDRREYVPDCGADAELVDERQDQVDVAKLAPVFRNELVVSTGEWLGWHGIAQVSRNHVDLRGVHVGDAEERGPVEVPEFPLRTCFAQP